MIPDETVGLNGAQARVALTDASRARDTVAAGEAR